MKYLNSSKLKQQGMATMLMSLIMVMTVSLISIYSAQVGVVEQKISSNHYRARQAFEAAQAGMDASIYRLTSSIVNGLVAAGGAAPVGTESDLPFDHIQTSTFTTHSGNGHYSIEFTKQSPDTVELKVWGFSGDNSSTNKNNADQQIQQLLKLAPALGYQPPANLVSLGKTSIGSNVSITNTTGDKLAAAWSGDTIEINSDGSDATIDVTAGGGTGIYSSDADLKALESAPDSAPDKAKLKHITQNNKFFENFFNESKARFKDRSTVVNCQSGCGTNDLKSQLTFDTNNDVKEQIIWVDAYDEDTDTTQTLNLDKNFTLGSANKPVILVVEGNIKFSQTNAHVYGVVYTTSGFSNGIGKGKITGSLISEGDITANGNLVLDYDNDTTMTNVMNGDGTSRYTRVAGTWKDF